VRFFSDGNIDAKNGGPYDADVTVGYSSGTSYHFRLVIDVVNSVYDIYVTPSGQSEILLGDDFDFRTAQIGVGTLDNWGLISDVSDCTVSNLGITD
jgi:hypothetical protein